MSEETRRIIVNPATGGCYADDVDELIPTIQDWTRNPVKYTGSTIEMDGQKIYFDRHWLQMSHDDPSMIKAFREVFLRTELRDDTAISIEDVVLPQRADRHHAPMARIAARANDHPPDLKMPYTHVETPPMVGQFILSLLLPVKTREDFLGTFEEEYDNNSKLFGLPRAKALYWWDVARSVGPIVEAFVIRLCKLAGLAWLPHIIRHYVGK